MFLRRPRGLQSASETSVPAAGLHGEQCNAATTAEGMDSAPILVVRDPRSLGSKDLDGL